MGDDNQQQQQTQDNNAPWQPPARDQSSNNNSNGGPISDPLYSAPPVTPNADLSVPELPANGTPDGPAGSSNSGQSPVNDDLINLKQQALQQLSPLVSHLDQTPEEKFRTTMMMIQASDDQSLIKSAFEAAQAITEDKARAQALLDVINEINYFTQNQQ